MTTSLPVHPVTDHAAWAQVARYPSWPGRVRIAAPWP